MKLEEVIIFSIAVLGLFATMVSQAEKSIQPTKICTGFYTDAKQTTNLKVYEENKKSKEYEEYETGIASWYGNKHRGRKMANGQKFNPDIVSFAHRELPINLVIRVTNLENGKTILGRVSDRGIMEPRILDVSENGAKILGFKKKGLAQVKIEIYNHPG